MLGKSSSANVFFGNKHGAVLEAPSAVLDLTNKSHISEESKDKVSSKDELTPYQVPTIPLRPFTTHNLKIGISSSRSTNQEYSGNCHLWSHRLKAGETEPSQKSARSLAVSKKSLLVARKLHKPEVLTSENKDEKHCLVST